MTATSILSPVLTDEKILDFTVEEYEGRVSAAQKLMQEQGISALFITQYENISYFSGYVTWLIRISKHRPSVLFLPATGKPTLIIPGLEIPAAELICWMDDIRGWDSNYVPLWLDTFKELGISDGVIGAELGEESNVGMPMLDWQALTAGLPNAKWVDAQTLLYTLRSIKSPQEIAYMREAGRLAGEACATAWALLGEAKRAGKAVTEKDVANAMGATMMQGGALIPSFINVRASQRQGMMHNKFATERVIREGDWVAMDYGVLFKSYNSDIIRVGSYGKPLPHWEQYHAIQMDVVAKIEEKIRPGVTVKELCQIKTDTLALHGLEEPWVGFGHCIGLNVHELPRINPDVDLVLQPGHCFTVEPGFAIEGNTFCIEDVVTVTETGCEVLTPFPHDLFIA